jgi:hypothetical protein
MTLKTAHGSTCDGAGWVAAIAAVELKTIDPATRTPTTRLYAKPVMCFLLAQREIIAPAERREETP